MILGDDSTSSAHATTLDDVFQRAAALRPDAPALVDPPNREDFTDAAPRRLTYAQADRIVSAIAARLRDSGLPTDAVIGIQLPNTAEHMLTILGVLRAGMIPALLPLLWRRAEISAALGGIGARAIVTAARIDDFEACRTAMQVAAEVFPIRHIYGFGNDPPDGVTHLDDTLNDTAPGWALPAERAGNPAAHVALISFDTTPGGVVPVARNHAELIAGGIATLLESRLPTQPRLLTCIALGSFAGLALSAIPCLLGGGTLSLHHGFNPEAFARQCLEEDCDSVVVPGPLAAEFCSAGLLAHPRIETVLAAWRAPEHYASGAAWRHPRAALTDMLAFGDTALIGARRGADGLPAPLPLGALKAPSGSPHAMTVAEIERTSTGTLALRGPMVPRHAFAAPGGGSATRADPQGAIDTLYPCRVDPMAGTVTISGPPAGMLSVGAYRFVASEVERLVRRADTTAVITALPDALAGQRLAGNSGMAGTRTALAALDLNPLIAGAFTAPSAQGAVESAR